MGYILLWIENLAAGLLLVTTLVACISGLKRTWLRLSLSVLVALPPLIAYAGLLRVLGYLRFREMILVECFYPLVLLTTCYVIGAIGILFVGLRRRDDGPTAAAIWPRGKLALVTFVVVGLHMMTWWNLELSVRQHMATLEAEGGALRLSLAPAHLPDRENAALVYEQTYEALNQDSWPEALRDKWKTWMQPGPKLHDPELKILLDEQAATLLLLRQAGQKSGCHFGRDYGRMNLSVELPEPQKLFVAAQLLSLDAPYRALHGDMQTALVDVAAIFAIAEHMGSDPIMLCTYYSTNLHAIAVQTLEVVLRIDKMPDGGRLTTEQLQTFNLNSSLSFRRLYRRGLLAELAGSLTLFPMLTRDAEPWLLFEGLVGKEGVLQSAHGLPISFYRMFMVNADVASYRQMISTLRELAAKPYHEAQSDFENFEQTFKSKPRGFLSAFFAPVLSNLAEPMAISDARHQAARIALAAERFRHKGGNGDYPENLDALVPNYIPILPRDPFDGKPMKYRRIDEGNAVIYSVGPDGTDDNGTSLEEDDEGKKVGDVTFELKL